MSGGKTAQINIQPLDGMDDIDVNFLKKNLEHWYKIDVHILSSVSKPVSAWYHPRERYIADTLLTFLNSISPSKEVYMIGLTVCDISIMKDEGINWGIMGYGFQPGNACVVSSYRLKKGVTSTKHLQERILKVALHELGHNFGLPHCPDQTCFLVDAEGKNKLDAEVGFCNKCHNYLLKNGFQ